MTAQSADAKPKRKNKAEKKSAAIVAALQEELQAVRAELRKLTQEVERLRTDVAAKERPTVKYYTSPQTIPPRTSSLPGATTTTKPATPATTNPASPSSGAPKSTPPSSTAPSSTAPRIIVPGTGTRTSPTPSTNPSTSPATRPSTSPATAMVPAKLVIQGRELVGHKGPVTGLAISADGRTGATASSDGVLRIWDLVALRERAAVKLPQGQANCLLFTADGKQIYAASERAFQVVDVAKGEVVRTIAGIGTTYTMAISADGKLLATAGRGNVIIWDTATGKERKSVEVQPEIVRAVRWTKSGELLCVGGYANDSATAVTYFVRLWNIETGVNSFRLDYPLRTTFRDGYLAADDRRLILLGPDNGLREFDVMTGREMRRWSESVGCAAVSSDGKVLASGGSSRFITLRDIATGRTLEMLSQPGNRAESIVLSADGRQILVEADNRQVYYFTLDKVWATKPVAVSPPVAKPATTTAATVRPALRLAGHTDFVYAVAVSPDGKRAVSGGFDRSLRYWDLATGRQLNDEQTPGPKSTINDIAYLPDGKHVLLACGFLNTGTVLKLWDLEKWEEVRRFVGHERTVKCVAVSPDGKTAVSGSTDTTVQIWDIATGQQLHLLSAHTNEIEDVAFSPDGAILATCAEDDAVRLWDTATARELRKIRFSKVESLAFSPTKTQLVLGGGALESWNYETFASMRRFAGHEREVGRVSISPDGKRVLSSAFGQRACLHSTESGSLLLSVPAGQSAHFSPVAFTADSRRFITVGADFAIEVWDAPK